MSRLVEIELLSMTQRNNSSTSDILPLREIGRAQSLPILTTTYEENWALPHPPTLNIQNKGKQKNRNKFKGKACRRVFILGISILVV